MAKVLVGMSGGVDSAVAARILLDMGHEVTGVTLSLVPSDERIVDGSAAAGEDRRTCCSLEDVQIARETCFRLGIEHFVFNFREFFDERVIGPFVDSYLRGETPNPCVECNRHIKFGKLIERATLLGYDFVATGHYARVTKTDSGRHVLMRGVDRDKDQSYVLYPLTQDQLARVLFPLGEMTKAQVRAIAPSVSMASARKPESQDICFVPDGDYPSFISRALAFRGERSPDGFAASREGNFIDAEGTILGTHRGIERYTIGQRRGIGIALGKPTYVVAKDAANNTVTLGDDGDLSARTVIAREVNCISIPNLHAPMRVTAKIRYNQEDEGAELRPGQDGEVLAEFDRPQRAVAPGQSIVFYDGELVVGGGIITGKEN